MLYLDERRIAGRNRFVRFFCFGETGQPQSSPDQDDIHDVPAAPTWTGLWENAVPGRVHSRGAGHAAGPERSPCSGTLHNIICKWFNSSYFSLINVMLIYIYIPCPCLRLTQYGGNIWGALSPVRGEVGGGIIIGSRMDRCWIVTRYQLALYPIA